MDAVTLLSEAEAAGLTVAAQGDKLLVRGPKSAEPIVHRLAEHKPAILAALQPDWAANARKVIAQFTDPALRSDLTDQYDKTVVTLEHDLGRAEAEMQAFGLLLFRILALGIDVKAATRPTQGDTV